MWTLIRSGKPINSMYDLVLGALQQLPTIGPTTAKRLLNTFGEKTLADAGGQRLRVRQFDGRERRFGVQRPPGQTHGAFPGHVRVFHRSGGYQPTEFIKRYLPKDYFGLLVVDEGHEYRTRDPLRVRPWVCWQASAAKYCC
jgi:hypothetical protein